MAAAFAAATPQTGGRYAAPLELFAAATTFCAASASELALIMVSPLSSMMRRPSSTLVPARRTTIGHLDLELLDGVDDALRDPIAAVDAGEHVDEDRLDVLVAQARP